MSNSFCVILAGAQTSATRLLHKAHHHSLQILFACLWIVLCCFPSDSGANDSKRVLVLHSYHQGFDWTDSIQQGLARSLAVSYPEAELYVEYMNTKRQSINVMSPQLVGLYTKAYAKIRFDVIVVSDNNALDFLLQHQGTLFPGVPVVFSGINNIDNYSFDPVVNYTGVSEAADIVSTIAIGLKLHPRTTTIALISDATETGVINIELVRNIASQFPTISFRELNISSADSLSADLKQLTDDTIVLNVGFYRDGEGKVYSPRDSMDFILSVSPRPVYTLWDFAMAPGAMGGKLISGRLQGESAAGLVARILHGEKASSLPIVASPTEFTFDYLGLQKFSVSEALLPPGSIITGKPDTFYSRYQHYLWSGLTLFLIQVTIILLLIWNIVRRQREEVARQTAVNALRETNELFSLFMLHSPIYVFIKEVTPTESRVLEVSNNFYEMLGIHAADMLGKTMTQLFPDDLGKKITADDWDAFSSGKAQRYEEHLNGRQYTTIKFPILSQDKKLLAGYTIDITERKRSEAVILSTKNQLQATLDAIPDLLFEVGLSGRIYNCHARDTGQLLMPAEEFIGKSFSELIPKETAEICTSALHEALEKGSSSGTEFLLRMPDWKRWYEVSVAPMQEQSDQERHFILLARDITARKSAEEKIHLAASVFSHAREAIMITETNGAIIDVNDSFARITGYSRDEAIGQNPRILHSGRQDKDFYTAMWRGLIDKGHWYGELWNQRKDGESFASMQTISTVKDIQGNPTQYVSLFSDITTIKEHEKRLEHIAHYDALTTLPNRVLFADRLHQAMVQSERRGTLLALVYLDLDGFKAINDHYGHEAGDQLLIALSQRMKQALRQGDTLARLGGDEFVAVFFDLEKNDASLPMLDRLLEAAALPVLVDDRSYQVSASLGVTFYPQAEEVGSDQLLRQADQAMYQAKLAGKNRYHLFDTDQDRSIRGHHESLEHIGRALTAREFVLHYQPKVNMRTGTVIGVEALIRWQHPVKGLLPPAAFLPVIESHPLSVDIGEWVIDTALNQMEAWHALGMNVPVSVNVGARQLLQSDFADRLRSLFVAHPTINPGDLEIEILETSALEDLARTSQVIEECQKLGAVFALDDFGTGYSSLTYLKRLSVSQLKIDKSFVRDMLDDPDDLSILGGVLSLASAFRRQVIAEGVETVEHGTMLLQLGCELAQGYGIARPMPAADIPAWINTWHPDTSWSDCPPVDHADLPVLFAIVEHRAWITAVEAFLKGTRQTLPLVHHQCRFNAWLQTEGKALHDGQCAFLSIEPLHQRTHALADELCKLHVMGQEASVNERLSELTNLRDELLEQLQALIVTDSVMS